MNIRLITNLCIVTKAHNILDICPEAIIIIMIMIIVIIIILYYIYPHGYLLCQEKAKTSGHKCERNSLTMWHVFVIVAFFVSFVCCCDIM